MSLHRVDPRFALPHRVKTAIVLDGLGEWRTGLSSAGIEVLDELRRRGPAPDLVVSTARNADAARRMQPTSVIVEAAHTGPFRGDEYRIEQLLLRPTRERPTLALPLDQPAPISYALERWSVVDRRWKATRMRIARGLISHGLFPPWASPVVTVATRAPGPPRLVAAASAHGVANDAGWFLTLGQGDALSRNAFQLFRADADEPEWLLKFARVPDDAKRFDNDERGLRLAHAAGAIAAARVPRLLGRFEVDGVHASLETAAAGSRLRDILRTPAERGVKLELIAGIAEWILEWGRLTRTSSNGLGAELRRLRDEVVPRWAQFGATRALDTADWPWTGGDYDFRLL